MRRALLLMVALVLVAANLVAGRHGDGVNMSISDGGDFDDCGDLSVRFDGQRVPVVSEEIPFHGSQLVLRTEKHGGIRVVGTRGNSYGVTVCKAAAPGTDIGAIRAAFAGNELTATGPEDDRWVAYFIIRAPRDASLDLEANNGPISIANFHGTVKAQATNGPVSVKDSSGTINAETTNGPVSIDGGSGNIRLEATNGPVSVDLTDSFWNGSLEASTKNGPLSLDLPRGFRSGVLVESLGHGPISCRAEGCPEARERYRTYDDGQDDRPRRIELGSGPQVVRLSTTNGPVTVREN